MFDRAFFVRGLYTMDATIPLLSLEHVQKTYARGVLAVHALRDVNLHVNSGEFLTIMGPSGSGKSTLLNILGLLDAPSDGTMLFEGVRVPRDDFNSLAALRSLRVGFVFQHFNLVPVLSASENIALPLLIRSDITDEEKKERVSSLLAAVGLEKQAKQRPAQLSGGQQQRVAIARAMVCKPALVLADEPTANLDSENTELVLRIMQRMNEDYDTTFVFSTHDMRVERYAKRRITLRDGAIVDDVYT